MNNLASITLPVLAERIHCGARAVLLVRHAERPPLPANDLTFGRDLPLTAQGVSDAARFGRTLARHLGDRNVTVISGGNRRCLETAFHMFRGMGVDWEDERCAVNADPYLGGRSYDLGDVRERMELADSGNYLENLNAYFLTGLQRGFNPLHPSTALFVGHLLWHYGAQVLVGITHDLNVACFFAGNGVTASFTPDTWPHFLDAAVLLAFPDGHDECFFLERINNA